MCQPLILLNSLGTNICDQRANNWLYVSSHLNQTLFFVAGAVGGDGDDSDDKEKEEEAERERQEAIREAEERRKEKHRKMEEEREKMRQEIRDKVG